MALLPELWEELTGLSQEIKNNINAETVEKFKTVLNRAVPSGNVQDEIRYEEFRSVFALDRKGIINSLLHSNDIYTKSKILWTAANHIVRAFGLNHLLFIEWQHLGNYQVSVRQIIDGVEDPQSKGYSFGYRLNEPEVQRGRKYSSSSNRSHSSDSDSHRKNSTSSSSENTGFLDNGFVQVGAKKKNKTKAKSYQPKQNRQKSMTNFEYASHPKKQNSKPHQYSQKKPNNTQIKSTSASSNDSNASEIEFLSESGTSEKNNDRKLSKSVPADNEIVVNPFENFKATSMTMSWADIEDDDDFM